MLAALAMVGRPMEQKKITQLKSQFRVLVLVVAVVLGLVLPLHLLHPVLGEGRDLLVVVGPLGHDPPSGVELGLLREGGVWKNLISTEEKPT